MSRYNSWWQILDLDRFGVAKEGGKISAFSNNEELDDYTYRETGCVGAFLTKMSLAHLIPLGRYKEEELLRKA